MDELPLLRPSLRRSAATSPASAVMSDRSSAIASACPAITVSRAAQPPQPGAGGGRSVTSHDDHCRPAVSNPTRWAGYQKIARQPAGHASSPKQARLNGYNSGSAPRLSARSRCMWKPAACSPTTSCSRSRTVRRPGRRGFASCLTRTRSASPTPTPPGGSTGAERSADMRPVSAAAVTARMPTRSTVRAAGPRGKTSLGRPGCCPPMGTSRAPGSACKSGSLAGSRFQGHIGRPAARGR